LLYALAKGEAAKPPITHHPEIRRSQMKKLIIFLCSLAMVFALAEGASALSYSIVDVTKFTKTGTTPAEDLIKFGRGDVNKLDGIGDYVYWKQQFEFIPPAVSITDASLEILFCDDEYDRNFRKMEFAFGYGEDHNFDFGEIDSGFVGPYALNVDYLRDGMFKVKVASVWGDFYIKKSVLKVNYEGAAPVPEPSTILLMGAGLLGLVTVGRRKFNRKE
jgi:hypothetical protein